MKKKWNDEAKELNKGVGGEVEKMKEKRRRGKIILKTMMNILNLSAS